MDQDSMSVEVKELVGSAQNVLNTLNTYSRNNSTSGSNGPERDFQAGTSGAQSGSIRNEAGTSGTQSESAHDQAGTSQAVSNINMGPIRQPSRKPPPGSPSESPSPPTEPDADPEVMAVLLSGTEVNFEEQDCITKKFVGPRDAKKPPILSKKTLREKLTEESKNKKK